MNRLRLWMLVGMVLCLSACESKVEEASPEEPWTQERVEALRMPGVVDEPGKIYRKAYDRAMGQITADNLVERLEALEREIEMERNELR